MKKFLGLLLLSVSLPVLAGDVKNKAYMGPERSASEEIIIPVSKTEFNRIVFPKAFTNLLMDGQAPIKNDFMPVSDNRGVLFEIKDDADEAFLLIAELEDGSVRNLRLQPEDRKGVIFRVDGASDRVLPVHENKEVKHDKAVAMVKSLLESGSESASLSGYENVSLPSSMEFDRFSVTPIFASTDGMQRLLVYRIDAKNDVSTLVEPPQFYTAGMRYILIDGDVVKPNESLTMYVLFNEARFVSGGL